MTLSRNRVQSCIETLASLRVRETLPIRSVRAERITVGDDPAPSIFTLQTGSRWGESDAIYLMRAVCEIPEPWRGGKIAVRIALSDPQCPNLLPECLLIINGVALQAIDHYHHEAVLPPTLAASASIDIALQVWSGLQQNAERTVHTLELRLYDEAADSLYYLMRAMYETAECADPQLSIYSALTNALNSACNALDFRKQSPEDFYISCAKAYEHLCAARQNMLIQNSAAAGTPLPALTAVGHAHIDVAWLWRLKHTRLKTLHTFTTALTLMESHPDYHFFASTPQLYQFIKEDHPDVYAKIKEKIAAGQWEAEGATWLEMDTNITGAESLVRQFMIGQRFFREEFGHASRVLWLPDVFGYSATLPQLMKKSGVEYFVTTKLSWNETNRFPYDTFWWESLDGSRVLAQFITAPAHFLTPWMYTYNGEMTADVVSGTWKMYQQKSLNHELLLAFGWGDGGGGPTEDQVTMMELFQDSVSPEMPRVKSGGVIEALDRIRSSVLRRADTPKWVGELYLEYHRGTYTSQAYIKKAMRTAERDMHNAEWLALMSHIYTGAEYPYMQFDALWKTLLLNQFHDILPGSSIAPVYDDARKQFTALFADLQQIIQMAVGEISAKIHSETAALLVFNPLDFARDDVLCIDRDTAQLLQLPYQETADQCALVYCADIPSFGYSGITSREVAPLPENAMHITATSLENSYYKIELNVHGQITRLFDKQWRNGIGRDLIPPGERGNIFQLFEDRPLDFDAWEISPFVFEKQWELNELTDVQVIETGPLRGGIQLRWSYAGRTFITQRMYVYAHSRRIDFVTEIDWREKQTLLKAAFPVAVRSLHSTAEIQFGVIQRPTHTNTSWDKAQFETSAHTWVDLSEGDYGIALLNDSKYGYDAKDNVLRITLLKSAIDPDPHADEGLHQCTYSLFPHSDGWFDGGVRQAAHALNTPFVTTVIAAEQIKADTLPSKRAFVLADESNIAIETVKRAENADAAVIRIFESGGRRGPFTLRFPCTIVRAEETDLLEEHPISAPISAAGNEIYSTIQPYEIKTFVVYFA